MADTCNYHCFVLLAVTTVFLGLPRFTSGLQSPTNVQAQSVNDAKFLIISWDHQADVNYSTIHIKTHFKTSGFSGNSTTIDGPTAETPCNSSTCSFCVADIKRNASCLAFNPEYRFSVAIELNFEFFVSYRVGACSRNESSSCINSPWKTFTIPPGEFSDYTLHKKMCLDHDSHMSLDNNTSVEYCAQKCSNDTSCKSFEYGHGYNSQGEFQNNLFIKELGQCKLKSVNRKSYKLKSCGFNYYEKNEDSPPGSRAVMLNSVLLLSLSVAIPFAL
ncbi:uncharacterized protein LOC110059879 [Orbicella faveolata]|uniref:uncharacterized protein LOC110059879 n=1 Tax=Orbicella faveolata TaxID=48498 RepID=UPI0009E3AB4A|nr:uncharacterized protein LOC110059879 [Orbicella faveolata]